MIAWDDILGEIYLLSTRASPCREVFKFKLRLSVHGERDRPIVALTMLEEDRLIPSWVKLEVWKRDPGCYVDCGAASGLHFDHIIPRGQ